MRCAVVGIGNLGGPLAQLLAEAGHEVFGHDANPNVQMPPGVEIVGHHGVSDIDMIFYVVPTPSREDGTYDTEMLEAAVEMWSDPSAIHVVVSTVLPGDCDRIFASAGLDRYVYSPEFIRLGHVREDMMNPDFVLIGADDKEAGDKVEEVLRSVVGLSSGGRPFHMHVWEPVESALFRCGVCGKAEINPTETSPKDVPFVRLSVVEAELAKIALNNFVTMKISFANALGEIAAALGADGEKVCDAIGHDRRIGHRYFKPGGAFAGPCFPRDQQAFIACARRLGIVAYLAIATDRVNEKTAARIGFNAAEGDRGY
jgi:UDPglucose 6-dehydrogenase